MVFLRSLSRQVPRPATSLLTGRAFLPRTSGFSGIRTLTATANRQGKVLMVLYDVSVLSSVRSGVGPRSDRACLLGF
jgi:hypothetical protein